MNNKKVWFVGIAIIILCSTVWAPTILDEGSYGGSGSGACIPQSAKLGCTTNIDKHAKPYGYTDMAPEDYYGVACEGKTRNLADSCIKAYGKATERANCLIRWATERFPKVYDSTFSDSDTEEDAYKSCWCVGRRTISLGDGWKTRLAPRDVIACAETGTYPDDCEGCDKCKGCGVCVDFATTLYTMLMTCGSECGISNDNLYLALGFVGKDGKVAGAHVWLLYNHPDTGWVVVDPTMSEHSGEKITEYPCITFRLYNLNGYIGSKTPDNAVNHEMCSGYGIDLYPSWWQWVESF